MKTVALLLAILVPAPGFASLAPRDGVAERATFNGRRIDISFKDGSIHDVLRLLSDAGGVNIVTSAEVKGTVTIDLQNTPWDEVLDIVARSAKLVYARQGTTIYVRPAK